MDRKNGVSVSYSIFDPTGNITALAESPVDVSLQPYIAEKIMEAHPEVEQTGFVRYAGETEALRENPPVHGSLRMAGGEFCGNAAMSAGALCLLRKNAGSSADQKMPQTVRLRVSGADDPVEILLSEKEAPDPSGASSVCFEARVRMPRPLAVSRVPFTFQDVTQHLPVVAMPGISHMIVEPASAFFRFRTDKEAAAQAVREWCKVLHADGLGLMFLDPAGDGNAALTPLVYIPGNNTLFWENSCASGSSAAGMFLAAGSGAPVSLTLREPGGILRVTSDPISGETWLWGGTVYRGTFFAEIPVP